MRFKNKPIGIYRTYEIDKDPQRINLYTAVDIKLLKVVGCTSYHAST